MYTYIREPPPEKGIAMATTTVQPPELTTFIERGKYDISSSNNADHRPTYDAELDNFAKEAVAGHDRWLAIRDADQYRDVLAMARVLYEVFTDKYEARPDELHWRAVLQGKGMVLAPAYAQFMSQAEKLFARGFRIISP